MKFLSWLIPDPFEVSKADQYFNHKYAGSPWPPLQEVLFELYQRVEKLEDELKKS